MPRPEEPPEPADAAQSVAACCCWLLLQLHMLLCSPFPVAATGMQEASVLKVLLALLGAAAATAAASAVAAAAARLIRSPADGVRRLMTGRFASAAIAYVAALFISSLTALQHSKKAAGSACKAQH